jgi:catechol 2,3-dioxygenase-like lactoylglutathione lyase family enzyme
LTGRRGGTEDAPVSQAIVNHVGICVRDLARSQRFYEEVLGFRHWWQFEVPDELGAPVLRVPAPMGLTAVYLQRDGWVLELLHYGEEAVHQPGRDRSMAEPGLTHVSFSVEDLDATLAKVVECGGEVLADTRNEAVVFVRDPDGQLLELGTMAWREQLPPLP